MSITTIKILLSAIPFMMFPISKTFELRAKKFDIVVYGATPAGITTAIQSAKLGKRVALLEPSKHIGGIMIEGLGGTDIDNHAGFQNSGALGGLALEFYRRVSKAYGRGDEFEQALKDRLKKPALWRFEPSVAEKVLKTWLAEYKIDIFLEAKLSEREDAITKKGLEIKTILMLNGAKFSGKVFVDATVEGDLLGRAKISTIVGREANKVYDEVRNGIQEVKTKDMLKIKIDPYIIPGKAESGLIVGIQDGALGIPGEADEKIQGYCYRVCLTKDTGNQLPIEKPANYNRENYEIYLRYARGGGKLAVPRSNIPNGKTDFNGGGDLSHNLFGMNHAYPTANYKERDSILKYHRDFTQGLLYFLTNDKEIGELDPSLQKEWRLWGLAKDEFKDNGGWPRQLYVRDARRMVADYVITEQDIKKIDGIEVPAPVTIAFWPPDIHAVRRILHNGVIYNEGAVFGGNWWKPFGISYHSLVPKKLECTNLLTPTCPSSSHIAYGAIRLEWTFMSLGQVCGIAASIAIDEKISVQKVDYNRLKKQLVAEGVVIKL